MDNRPWGMEQGTFLTLMHLSQLAGYLIPYAGLALPVIMWATNKDDSELIDRHGKVILNWMITMIIASVVCYILMFVLIGFLGFAILAVVNLVFVIVGAVKASQGELWTYPFSLKIIK
ncbi:DUF4870 domain-containing protein [Alteromonas sediminis]|uniref:DUF4870 domain-containing protein n=1 Tax=Alteromonas sediminis TaxID=2259342 RepID=A0A3N5Y348_9ALTE|nr:DUF4870 domain-containing protein [Alteromonas sediminis]RPJ68407.1 DUF4870 domain-containing protein [Alteromonas sediminis]